MESVRDLLLMRNRRRGQMLSGSSMGYLGGKPCPANIRRGDYKNNTHYEPCGEIMYLSKRNVWVCPIHGDMH